MARLGKYAAAIAVALFATVLGQTYDSNLALFRNASAASCLTGNPIEIENCKPGNPESEWQIDGAGDPSIQGFATDISVNRGQTVTFKVDSPSAFRIDIYRLGYYGGLGARRIDTIGPFGAPHQPPCTTDVATGLVDCGAWSSSGTFWPVPADATSGIYLGRLVRADGTNGASHMVFIVRDDAGGSDVLFQTSDTTWQAYNNYGGRSLYDSNSSGGRARKVSYNRPFNTRSATPEDWLFNAEYPMVRWLEANGYDVSYFTGVDTDRYGSRDATRPDQAQRHPGPQSVPVGRARRGTGRVPSARMWRPHDRQGSTWPSSAATRCSGRRGGNRASTGRTRRTARWSAYKETHGDAVDPDPAWTGTWRDPSGGGQPENALTGTIFMVNHNSAAIKVPQADGRMRFWRNTSIASLAEGATATLPVGTLGYEWDEDLDNGSRPAGLIRLSHTTENVSGRLQDHGSTYGNGTATHSLTLYKAPSGALVFGAGTIQWAWGLDANHDRGNQAADRRMQQATVNLLADMGVQPATLQADLSAAAASIDTTAPVSTMTSPLSGAALESGVPITITGTASDSGGVVGGVEVSVDGGTTWHPAPGRNSWSYTWTPGLDGPATLKSRAVDDSGNIGSAGAGVTVAVAVDAAAPAAPVSPSVGSVSPAPGAFTANIGVIITATFSQAMDPATIGASTFELRDGANTLVPATVTYSAATNTASLDPSSVLAYSTMYTVRVKGGATDPRAKDVVGAVMPSDYVWSFTTPATARAGPRRSDPRDHVAGQPFQPLLRRNPARRRAQRVRRQRPVGDRRHHAGRLRPRHPG